MFIENLKDINSTLKSDHILNLLPEVEGNLATDKGNIIGVLEKFLNLSKEEQMIYQVGRRVCYMNSVNDLQKSSSREAVENIIFSENITLNNIDNFIEKQINQFI